MSEDKKSFFEVIFDFFASLFGARSEAEPMSGEGEEPQAGGGKPVSLGSVAGEPASPGGEAGSKSKERGQTMLEGKGLWAYREQELDRAIQIAPQMGATHILYKVGHGASYRPGMAQMAQKIKAAGSVPFAWTWLLLDDPQAEAQVVVKAFGDGFEGVIFDTEAEQCRNRFDQATQLGQYLAVAGVDQAKLYNCSFPNITHHRDLPYDQLNAFCRGGLMPMSYGSYFLPTSEMPPEQQAQRVIDEWTYGHYEYWCLRWGYRPPLYPILGPYHDEHGNVRMPPAEFQIWLDHLAAYGPSFFSVFTAAVINDDLLPLIKAVTLGKAPKVVPTIAKVEVVSPEAGFLNIRPEPSTAKPPIAQANHGDVLEGLEPVETVKARVGQQGQWLHIRTPAGIAGYAAAWYLKLHEEPAPPSQPVPPSEPSVKVEVVSPSVGYLNVRSEPSTNRPPVTQVDDGDVLQALEPGADVHSKVGQQGQWLHIRTPEDIEGYVAAWYMRIYEESGGVAGPVSYLVVHSSAGLNVRPAPGTSQNPTWHVEDRTVLEALEDPDVVGAKVGTDQWIKVRTPSLHEGFVNGAYVRAKQVTDARNPVSDSALPDGECAWIFGIHAAGGTTPADFRFLFQGKNKTGWVLFTEAIGDNPNHGAGVDFTSWSNDGYGVIVRLNNGYGSAGTLPVSNKYADFAGACARYVQNSQGCHIWIIGNEQNNPREHPGGEHHPQEHIRPEMYAHAFNLARQRIKAVDPKAVVVPGAVDPYFGLSWKSGEVWRPLDYFKTMLAHIDDLDGVCLHTYTHWLDVDLITVKKVFTDPPLDPGTPNEHYYDFQAYRSFAEAIPGKWHNRPIYLTESNHWMKLDRAPHPNEHVENGWLNRDVGWVRAAYAEIHNWNNTPHAQQIHCYLLYRWTGDEWAIEGLGEVQSDFKKALDHDYRWRR
ncbi:MAG: SH3 domain-containing protein [Anaerolineae bacterium]|nr:SH3 domain-containing protein [Anaerolineae bacterium]